MNARNAATRMYCAAPGGALAPGALGELARAAHQFLATAIHMNADQNFWFDLPDVRAAAAFHRTSAARLFANPYRQLSLSSSVASAGIEPSTPWLTESIYFDLFDAFEALRTELAGLSPSVEPTTIHICDPLQSLSPRCPADWNFLASGIRHHWHLAVYDRRGVLRFAPYLLPSYLLAQVVRAAAETHAAAFEDRIELIQSEFADSVLIGSQIVPPAGPELIAPYEGLFPGLDATTRWLGVFRETFAYAPLFLDELSYLCRKHNVGRIYLTSLHSLLIKHIPGASAEEWRRLIARHGLNLRHDNAALFWQVAENYQPVRDRIVRALREQDAGTAGLSFAVGPLALRSGAAIAVVPEGAGVFGERFSIYQREDFRHQSDRWQQFRGNLRLRELSRTIPELCQRFYNHFTVTPSDARAIEMQPSTTVSASFASVHECSQCLTRYDARYGDVAAGVAPGVDFDDLPADYVCPVCEAPLEAFQIYAARPAGISS